MSIEIKTPELPESVDEATLLTWHAEAGDTVRRDDKIADVETDKIVLEVFAPQDGVLTPHVEEGGILQRGDLVATISADGAAPAPKKEKSSEAAPEGSGAPADRQSAELAEAPAVDVEALAGLSPSVRKIMIEFDVDPDDVVGTGKGGKITKGDVVKYLEETPTSKKNIGLGISAPAMVVGKGPKPAASQMTLEPTQKRVPMSQIRARIATRLKEVQNTAALLTTFNEVNMKPVMDLRAKYKTRFEQDYGVKLGFMSFFVKASVEALKKFPIVNAQMDGRDVIYNEAYHVGVAVDSPRGLVVPVLRNAENMSFADVEKNVRQLAGKAREAKLAYEDLIGGTFTITNGGVFGSMLSTPIINAPQSAILGMHAIQERPWVEDGQVVVRPVMYLALTYDHRIIDGRDAVQFLVSMKESLEDPAQLMLQL